MASLEAEVRQFVGFDTKRVHNNPGGVVAIVAVDCLLEKISSHVTPRWLSLAFPPILFCLAPDRVPLRVSDLRPMRRPSGAVRRAKHAPITSAGRFSPLGPWGHAIHQS
jgi:hypothetical protein